MIKRACLLSILVVAGAMTMVSCGGGGGSTPPPPTVTVSITTNVMNIETFQTVQFAATVTGTSNTAVTWQLSCNTLPVSVCGTMSASGLYVAPNTVPTLATTDSTDPAELIVTAISQADSSASATTPVFTINSLNLQLYNPPIPLGTSGGNANAICPTPAPGFCFGGTLGSLLTSNATPAAMVILSNNHVLGMSDGAMSGQEVTQPGVIETGCLLAGTNNVATVTNILSLQSQPIPAFPVDVTTAQITTGQVELSGNILELGVVTNGVPQPAPPAAGSGMAATMGQLLAKSGRTTGLTCATVDSTNTSMIIVGYEVGCTTTPFNVTYNDEVVVANMSNGQSFIGDGDSGSLAVDELTAEPVALMFAGSDTDAVGNPVADVLNALHTSTGHTYSFVGAGQHTVPGCQLPGLSSVKATPQSASATLPASTLQRGQTAAKNNSSEIMSTPGVSAYGGGGSLDAPNEPAVMIVVAPGASHANIPATIDGVRTRLVESNSPTARGPLTPQQTAQLATQSAEAQTITISDAAIEQTKSIKEQHVADLMSDPAVIGVGVSASLDSRGDPALMIYVLKGKAHSAIPATIDGVRTRVKETGPFRANVAHPLKSTTSAAGCRVPKPSPTTGLNATPTALKGAPPSRSGGQ
jgi:hypothetical protein